MTHTALAIDPGSSKCGFALVEREGDHLHIVSRGIVPTTELGDQIEKAQQERPFRMVIVGDGTRSQTIVAGIRDRFPSMGILVVDEKETTLQARERYWEFHKRRGWRRFLPSTLQMPPEPFDDFVALILAERVLLA